MRRFSGLPAFCLMFAAALSCRAAGPDPAWLGHDRNRPAPPVVDPGYASSAERVGKAPSDAVVLFDGTDLSRWVALDGAPTKWVVRDGALECVPGSGWVRSQQSFGACQLHVEFATPAEVKGKSQGRGNSGVFFGLDRYEVQVLDSYENPTYADGSCGSIYNQFPPLVNASGKPGEWQSYDILWTPPQFKADGALVSPARVTVFHNGVLIQNNVELSGPALWLDRPPYKAHGEKLPIALQDHGNPVRYRNIWVRELDAHHRPEFMYANSVLDALCGTYKGAGDDAEITRRGETLVLKMSGFEVVLYAASPTHFFGKIVDIHANFDPEAKTVTISVGEEGGAKKKKAN